MEPKFFRSSTPTLTKLGEENHFGLNISQDIGQNTIFYGGHFEIQNGGLRRG